MKNKQIFALLVLIVVVGAVVYILGGKVINKSQNTQTVMKNPPVPSGIHTFQTSAVIEGNEFKFTPLSVVAELGKELTITFKNTGKYPHNLTIPGLNIKTKTIQPGEEDKIVFTPKKSGPYPFMCTVDSHADKGMRGILMVR